MRLNHSAFGHFYLRLSASSAVHLWLAIAFSSLFAFWEPRFIAQPSRKRKSVREKLSGHLQAAQPE